MKGYLNKQQADYIFFHLGHHLELHDALKETFVFSKGSAIPEGCKGKIIWRLSENDLIPGAVSFHEQLPVLFPFPGESKPFRLENGNLIFGADLLKSSFYLLSGYQETEVTKRDSLGRFDYEASIQHMLNFTDRPLVNYYFEEIIGGVEEFCKMHYLPFSRKSPFVKPVFFLTHDVDRISYYTVRNLLFRIKQLTGLSQADRSKFQLLKEIIDIKINLLNVFRKRDPYWNFDELSEIEQRLGLHSTWFFLPGDQLNVDSYYQLKDIKIKTLIRNLKQKGHETGLHGTVRSHTSEESMRNIVNEFQEAADQTSTGIRQHRLMWDHPLTALIQEKNGILYDSTMGFAAHEGFRNSYCQPFRLFDFTNNRMLETWEIPLNLMDSTLFHYRKLNYNDAYDAALKIAREIFKFNGVFTLLWHNHYLNDFEKPGISDFYKELLKDIMAFDPEPLTGLQITEKMNKND